MNLTDLGSSATPAVPRKSLESTGSATSPNGGVKPTPVRKARLVENWLDSPVLKAMQVGSREFRDEMVLSLIRIRFNTHMVFAFVCISSTLTFVRQRIEKNNCCKNIIESCCVCSQG